MSCGQRQRRGARFFVCPILRRGCAETAAETHTRFTDMFEPPKCARKVLDAALAGMRAAGGAGAPSLPARAPPGAPSDTLLYMVRRAYRLEDGSEWQPLMEWLTVKDKARLAHSCRAWWTYVPPRYNARQARLVIEESILWPAIIDAPGRYGETRLHWASLVGKLSRVETLIKWGADVNKASSGGVTPLMAASYSGHADIARALLAAGADVNAADNGGWTALMYASYWGRVEIVRDLLAAGADKHAVNNDGEAAHVWAGRHGTIASAPAIRALLAAAP